MILKCHPLRKEIDPTLIESINFSDYDKEKKIVTKNKDEIFLNHLNLMEKIITV